MKNVVKSVLKRLINLSVAFMDRTSVGRYLYAQIIKIAMSRTEQVSYLGLSLFFSIPNALNKYRVDTFATKEPETLEWIDGIPRGSWFGILVSTLVYIAVTRQKCGAAEFLLLSRRYSI